MTILLNNVYVALEQGIINTDQALYLIYTQRNNLSYKGKRIVSAYTAQIHSGNKIGKELLIEENIKLELSNLFTTQKYPSLLRY
jgi:hypothetical protein